MAGRVGSIELLGLRLFASCLPGLKRPQAEFTYQVRYRTALKVKDLRIHFSPPRTQVELVRTLRQFEPSCGVRIELGTSPREDSLHSSVRGQDDYFVVAVDLHKVNADGSQEEVACAHRPHITISVELSELVYRC